MRAVILSVGSELLRGDITDTNAAFLARALSHLGIEVARVEQRGDDLQDLSEGVKGALSEADVLVCTGGLGPTQDDLTRQAIARALDEQVYEDEALIREIEARFQGMGRSMPARNRQQGTLIPSSDALHNPNGTAPGWFVQRDGKVIAALPGPPREMQPMWREAVEPRLEQMLRRRVAMLPLMTFGLGESALEARIDDVIAWRSDVTVATYAKENGVQVHITARAETDQEATDLLREAERRVRERLSTAIFGTGDQTLADVAGALLLERSQTLAVMESCTGGDLADLVTDVPGSSDYFRGGVVTYTREAKARFGVQETVMERHGLISEETARAMADAARALFGSDYAIGVTGIAGSEPVEGKPPGTVYLALTDGARHEVREIHRPGARSTTKRFAAQCALDLLRRYVLESKGTP